MAAKNHHASTIVNYLGPSAELPLADLPTLRDVLKQGQLLRERHLGPNSKYEVSDMASDLLPLIIAVWNRANAKLVDPAIRVSDKKLKDKIQKKWTTLTKIAAKKGGVTPREKESFTSDLDKLFNILVSSCNFKCAKKDCPSIHIGCSCSRESKI